ncbi:unnamed protein product [Parnassius apollo]|uniref:(apollo) hypothetical protein n=1 Tax=Parnassius apollo TaxID=110799 RepID=A0A8S3VY62_PARAO|nr:unnamed protein product [Parnassius apollo]
MAASKVKSPFQLLSVNCAVELRILTLRPPLVLTPLCCLERLPRVLALPLVVECPRQNDDEVEISDNDRDSLSDSEGEPESESLRLDSLTGGDSLPSSSSDKISRSESSRASVMCASFKTET